MRNKRNFRRRKNRDTTDRHTDRERYTDEQWESTTGANDRMDENEI